jgi:hypothetical protein
MGFAIPLTLASLLALLTSPAIAVAEAPPPAQAPPPQAPPEDHAWTVSLGTGAGGFVEFVDAFSNGGPSGYDASRREHRLQVNVRADRELNRSFRAGVAGVYNRWTEAYLSNGARIGSIDNSVVALMADVTARWIRTEHLELSSALAAGAAKWRQDGRGIGASQHGVQSGFAFQLRYIGIAAGNGRIRAFIDLGIGFEGLVVGGLALRL